MNGRVEMAKRRAISPLPSLKGAQLLASEPSRQIRLSASAGTGKTQVLSARVLRLLLSGVEPEAILCLTFTKAGAAEMADRIHKRLGAWVTMPRVVLAKDLSNLGEGDSPEECEYARGLFAKVLDARGSGLRIQTIHGFCQTLLAGFPAEAGLPPGFRAIEGRDEQLLAAQALADMVDGFEREGRLGDLNRLKVTAKRLSEQSTRAFLQNCAVHSDVMAALGPGVEARVRAWLGIYDADVEAVILAGCADDGHPHDVLMRMADANRAWGGKKGAAAAAVIAEWLALSVAERSAQINTLHNVWAKQDGEPRSTTKGQAPPVPEYPIWAEELYGHFAQLVALRRLAAQAQAISDALITGQSYARAYVDAKRAAGVVDFNDLIRSTVTLLKTPGVGAWIAFKLDQKIDHILIDEAQDTNVDQWEIVKALAGEFFAGAGQKGPRVRTIFKVGDFKQAIFGFQGTDPREFERATADFKRLADEADQVLDMPSLNSSFRSSQPILNLTDAVLNSLGHAALGLPSAPEPHVSAVKGSGSITLMPPVAQGFQDEEEEAESDDDGAPKDVSLLTKAEILWAEQLAGHIQHWVNGGLYLRNQDRPAEPGDIMILVRNRADLARLIVSRLYDKDVKVAGIDRLRLTAPIAVQDLLACVRFALQPLDDLSLACLLVSPLVGWSQDDLYTRIKGREGALWPHLRATLQPDDLEIFYQLLNMVDATTPFEFLETILTGPIAGRRKLITRLGSEARDPIEELLNAALLFEAQSSPSLQLFVDWFDKGEVEIKRDPAKPENAVRVMTVHGAKGLQAPIVVLADATSDPDYRRKTALDWMPEDDLRIPLFRPKKEDLSGTLKISAEAQDQQADEEHWRLLYVAMTRAEEHLFVGGALKPKQVKAGMGEKCWHVQVQRGLEALGGADEASGLVYRLDEPVKSSLKERDARESAPDAFPVWALSPARAESVPPRPLAPSKLGTPDDEANPPPDAAKRALAKRGIILHSLFERLPDVPSEQRAALADKWLRESAGVLDEDVRSEMVASVITVISDPQFQDIFGPGSFAEVPLAGVVRGQVISGTVDRILIQDDHILVVDFKTGRKIPADAAAASPHHKAQMAAYVAVLQLMFPGRNVVAALLYTHAPKMIALSADMIEAFKPGFTPEQ
jgi:ATP-dependent helicase/nuclease subunit A